MKDYNEENNELELGNLKDISNESENKQFISLKNNYSKNDYYNEYYLPNNKNIIDEKDLSPKLNLSRYKTSKLFGITFYHIGNLYVFGFITFQMFNYKLIKIINIKILMVLQNQYFV